jgi:hypothetical protein
MKTGTAKLLGTFTIWFGWVKYKTRLSGNVSRGKVGAVTFKLRHLAKQV